MQRLIYVNLNKCLEYGQFYIGEVWIPEIYFPELQNQIKELLKENDQILLPQFEDFTQENNRTYRTFFRTNDFSFPFQEIVNTYGIPRYKEANPGLFTIITFLRIILLIPKVELIGLEPTTSILSGWHSNQLKYSSI